MDAIAADLLLELDHFDLGESTTNSALEFLGQGHIHTTFRLTTAKRQRFVLQDLNTHVFQNVGALMENFARVTAHLKGKGATTLELIPTRDGEMFRASSNRTLRLTRYVENTFSAPSPPTPASAESAAFAFGEFARQLSDLPLPPLHTVIPDFHNTPLRLERFKAVAEIDPAGRATDCTAEIDEILSREAMCHIIPEAMAEGSVPERIAHNDAKLDNVLFDAESDRAVCVIDLDTVMPGSVLHDFGDLVRSAAATCPEDEADLSKVGISEAIYSALTEGYLRGAGELLTARERELLPFAARLITYEQALRFLADHLLGDVYYGASHPGQNLDRARNQLCLLGHIESLHGSSGR